MKSPKIIFFTEEAPLSKKEKALAASLGFPVQFRNSRFFAGTHTGAAEDCDGVIAIRKSVIPKEFQHLPDGEEVYEAWKAERIKRFADIDDETPDEVEPEPERKVKTKPKKDSEKEPVAQQNVSAETKAVWPPAK